MFQIITKSILSCRLCEICGETAKNIRGIADDRFMEEWNIRMFSGYGIQSSERSRGCWSGQPFCNFLLACLVIAFVLPWFFRINMFYWRGQLYVIILSWPMPYLVFTSLLIMERSEAQLFRYTRLCHTRYLVLGSVWPSSFLHNYIINQPLLWKFIHLNPI